jgi:hypothetical protein
LSALLALLFLLSWPLSLIFLTLISTPNPSWLTIVASGLTQRCELQVLGSRELNLLPNVFCQVAGAAL